MCSQPNTVFLGYSQDAVRRLPAVLSAVLSQHGYDVYRDKNHFRRFDAPSPSILTEIEQRSHYVLLLTPASVRYGFNLDERRLMVEIKHAIRRKRHIVVVWAYSETPLPMSWWTRSFFPEHVEHVQMDNVDVDQLVASLDSLLSGRASGRRQYPLTDTAGLEVEMRIDRDI